MLYQEYHRSPGLFWYVYAFFVYLAIKFDDLAKACDTLLILYLISPLIRSIRDLCYDIANAFYNINSFFDRLVETVDQKVSLDSLRDAIIQRVSELRQIIQNPADWLRYLVGYVFDLTPWEIQAWYYIPKSILQKYLPGLYPFYIDPLGEIVRQLSRYSSFLAGLFIDPGKEIRTQICIFMAIPLGFRDSPGEWPGLLLDRIWFEWRQIVSNPSFWIIQKIAAWYGWINYFLNDPGGFVWGFLRTFFGFQIQNVYELPEYFGLWFLSMLERYFQRYKDYIYRLGERILLYYVEGRW